MKKKIITLVSICIVAVCLCITSVNRKQELSKFAKLTLLTIESLANNESGGGSASWVQPKTERCKLELGGGMFTSSVERVCVFCAVPYSCTAVACGEAFYN
ncbi:hypothetical protein [Bacteroides sp.]